MSTIFTKIIDGEIPGRFVWKDDQCVAFMDIMPLSEGHLLLVPRAEIDRWPDLPAELAAHLFAVAHTISGALDQAFDKDRVALMQRRTQPLKSWMRPPRRCVPPCASAVTVSSCPRRKRRLQCI